MVASLLKWGNSNAIRIPKVFLEELSLKENDKVDLVLINNSIQIRKQKKHIALKDRIKSCPVLNEDELIVGSIGEEL